MTTATMNLPSVDFEALADLKVRMTAFTSRFDQFIAAGREQLRRERNDFTAGMVEDRITQRSTAQAIEQTRTAQLELETTLRAEAGEVREIESSIAEFSDKRAVMLDAKASLERQIRDAREVMARKREVMADRRRVLALQNVRNRPELLAWESQLGLEIASAGTDLLRFTFTHVDGRDAGASHAFVMDLASPTYVVQECHPAVPAMAMATALEQLNRTRDFSVFLKQVRKAFKSLY